MAIIFKSLPGWKKTVFFAVQRLSFCLNIFIPPVCLACKSRRWKKTPLCLTCLKRLKPLRSRLNEHGNLLLDQQGPSSVEFPFAEAHFLFGMTPELSVLIHGFKYRHLRRHIPFLCEYLRFRPELMKSLHGCDGIVAVPIHPIRRRERGYNQAEIIALELARLSGRPVLGGVLSRIRHTASQTKLAKRARGANLASAFACCHPEKIIRKKIFLVDDVFTTGATVSQCATLLAKAGVTSVEVLALAKVETNRLKDDFSLEMELISGYLA
jgi:ComF family protein